MERAAPAASAPSSQVEPETPQQYGELEGGKRKRGEEKRAPSKVEPGPNEVVARVNSLCEGVRILVPCNAQLAPQATVYFVFQLFEWVSTGAERPPWKAKKPQREAERLQKFFHLDLIKLLLHGDEIKGRRGLSYDMRLRDELYQCCFDSKPWDYADWEGEAVRVWRLLCQRETAGRLAAVVATIETLPGYLPPTAFSRGEGEKLGQGPHAQVWAGEDQRPVSDKGAKLALKVYGGGGAIMEHNLGNKELELELLEEAKDEILNLLYLKKHYPNIAICFPRFHSVERAGPFAYRSVIAFPRRSRSLKDLLMGSDSGLADDVIHRVLDQVLSALVILQTSPDNTYLTHALRDIKPANILVEDPIGPTMGVELCDMASLVQLPCESVSVRAEDLVKSTPMTPLYQAPECVPEYHHKGFAGRHADMWALGCTVFECCVGRHWQIDWASLGTDQLATQYIEEQIAAVPTTDPWILAVLRNTLKMNASERLLASDLLALKTRARV